MNNTPHPIDPREPRCADNEPREPCRVDTVPSPDTVPLVPPPAARLTTWHITFGTYATRLHDDPRPTVDRRHNIPGTPFPPPDPKRQQKPSDPPLLLTRAQRHHIEQVIPALCERGGWTYRTCAAPCEPGRVGPVHIPGNADHVHTLLAAPAHIHGKQVRHWLKRWLTQSLTDTFGPPPRQWWADSGSTKPVTDERYLINVTNYIHNQRTTPDPPGATRPGSS